MNWKGMINMFFDLEVNGIDYKELPLRAAIYANRRWFGDEEYEKTIASIKEYIKNETSWEVVGVYDSTNEEREFSRVGLQELIDDSYFASKFDVIVTTNPCEISDNLMVLSIVLESLNVIGGTPIFCIEDEAIICSEKVNAELTKSLVSSMCLHQEIQLEEKKYFTYLADGE